MRGGLLPRRFTLTGNDPPAVCSLWHFPSLLRSAQPLAGGPPYGARTFLAKLTPRATVRPASHLHERYRPPNDHAIDHVTPR